jgi:hypothetical protein
VLRGAGGVIVGLPLLEAMLPRRARAAAKPPKRFVVFDQNNGGVRGAWLPSGEETGFQFSRILKPTEAYRDSLVILDGIDNLAGKNSPGGVHLKVFVPLLTGAHAAAKGTFGPDGKIQANGVGWPENVSIDQKIAKHIGTSTRFPSLELGVQVAAEAHPVFRISYREVGQPLPPENDPRRAFARLFTGGSTTGQPQSQEDVLRRLARRQSVLDYVKQDLERLKARIGAEDGARVTFHLDAIREVERRLSAELTGLEAPVCRSVPAAGATLPQGFSCSEAEQAKEQGNCSDATFGVVGRGHIDVMALALRCDATRVASLQWSNSAPRIVYKSALGLPGTHHDIDHLGDAGLEDRTRICTWYAEHFAYLLKRFTETKDPDGSSLLDNSLVLWVTELGDGDKHSPLKTPYVLAGKAGGTLRGGRFLSYPGRAHNDLLVSCMNAFGIQESRFGREEYNKGPLPGLL